MRKTDEKQAGQRTGVFGAERRGLGQNQEKEWKERKKRDHRKKNERKKRRNKG